MRLGVVIPVLFTIVVFATLLMNSTVFASTGIFNAANWSSSVVPGGPSHSITAPAAGVVQLNWFKPNFLGRTSFPVGTFTYQTTAQDTASVTINWTFQGTDTFYNAFAKADVFAEGPSGRN